jgi:cell wall-associated NlpC family hydrolase
VPTFSTLSTARVRHRASVLLLVSAVAFGVVGTASPAEASTLQSRVINEAAHHKGQPYVYGAAGPTRFDCSGFTRYVYGRFGKNLPHNAAEQYARSRRIAKKSMAVGDLIFFPDSSGRIGHVAIYAGNGRMWHAPHSGTVVKLAAIYTNNYYVGRP